MTRAFTPSGETHDEDAWCAATFGMRLLVYLEDTGWLGPNVWLAHHRIHVVDDDVARLAQAGVSVTHCPCSSMALHSG